MKVRVILIKEVDSVQEAQLLFDKLKTAISNEEPIEKQAIVKDDTLLT